MHKFRGSSCLSHTSQSDDVFQSYDHLAKLWSICCHQLPKGGDWKCNYPWVVLVIPNNIYLIELMISQDKYFMKAWYVHFAWCFYINIYCIMGCYYMLCHNTYAYSLLFYKVYMKRENAGSWNSGLEKEQILETYSAQLQKPWDGTEAVFGINKKYWRKN